MRMIHTSDWHLGRLFHGIHMTEDQAYVLDQFTDLVRDIRPDVIMVSGDIFDRAVPPTEAVNLLDDVISKILIDYQVPIIMIAGNHDSPDRLGFGYRLMQGKGLHMIGKLNMEVEPVVIHDQHGPVFFHALPYVEPAVVRDKLKDDQIHVHDDSMGKLLQHLKNTINTQQRNVLLAHAFVAGGEESESERPLSVGGSGAVNASYFKDFDYVALGHLHRPQKVGNENVRYSGSLMKYSFSEAEHRKQVAVIEMDATGKINLEPVELRPRRDLRCLEGYLEEILKGPRNGESREDYLMVTLKDEGALLDPMGKLRKVYPNVLHIERPQILTGSEQVKLEGNFRKMREIDLFSSFLKQVTGQEITESQTKIFGEIINQHYSMMRGD
ncbi:exonuclease SbcD [Anaerosolibacter carboniphilus]|uniref:Nuclease SbcCD subunit D n=1 Tax=Anaerosolibacter carboniphilus TaxID=1417629 RepID=A0A841KVJ6_9FIRM|nr:exonuclease SbcCD subunit D [Anaerosolibacter carboniphilus]MBB6217674.1 exonuclease SbcD [Anaerosolibacter carboniphilus]